MTAILVNAALDNAGGDRISRVFRLVYVASVRGALASSCPHNVVLPLAEWPKLGPTTRPNRISEKRLPFFMIDRHGEDILPWLKENVTGRCEAIARYIIDNGTISSEARREVDWTDATRFIPVISLNFSSTTDAVNCKLRWG